MSRGWHGMHESQQLVIRNKLIVQQFWNGLQSATQLAKKFKISRARVYQLVHKYKNSGQLSGESEAESAGEP